jgi:hypothetical protein
VKLVHKDLRVISAELALLVAKAFKVISDTLDQLALQVAKVILDSLVVKDRDLLSVVHGLVIQVMCHMML